MRFRKHERAKTDLLQDGRFGEQWLTVTEQEITVWQQDKTQLLTLHTDELKDARAVSGIGGGTLLADMGNGPSGKGSSITE